ncbi:nitrite reductase (NAD(P)H) small subunit [Streptomyces lincolnensis]|uniref:nitrite reductase (NAD(P)H) small subunit n=1 Tax=Streptomyces lincolnensis TaxID=1915 RepID=UPI001E367CB6|nr:nitrite reductase (NAD(P)H) small subunit [Streptomyces lincolnensis]MCD7440598.1 nitrite reductase (NAD(P)H) small subunit [Streptomyces lincolnensis]
MKSNRKLVQASLSLIATGLLVGASAFTANAASNSGASFPKQDPAQCTAFGKKADARKAADTGQEVIGLWTDIFDMPEAQKLYETYLTPGPVTHERTKVGGKQVLADFRNADETKKAVSGIVDSLKGKLATDSPVVGQNYSLKQAGLGTDLPIAWSDLETTPGFVAGGLSGVELADGTFVPDQRKITGTYSLARTTVNGKAKVTLDVRGLTLTVRDAIDFCPGNLGSGMIRDVSLGMSRLERTPYRDTKTCDAEAKCFYAKPVLFKVTVPLNNVSVDVTDALSGKAGTGEAGTGTTR